MSILPNSCWDRSCSLNLDYVDLASFSAQKFYGLKGVGCLIKKENIFIYEISDNEDDYLLTFKLKNNKKIDLKFYFSNATIVNIKNGCIFSINGLNKLIELETNCEKGNVDYKNHKIKWNEYIDKLILSSKDKLLIKTIKKIKFND